ncbi:ALP1-like protein [Tanacetum coccineum]
MLEVVASQDLWIWHAFFRVAGANNDINVLDNSPLFDDLLEDIALVAPFAVNGVGFENGYYLADRIYSQWETFVKAFTIANDAKHSYIKKRHESARKDVERAFGVLQGRWGIIQQPAYGDDNYMFTMLGSVSPASWQGSHTRIVAATMVGIWYRFGDDDNCLFTMLGSPSPASWQSSHTQIVSCNHGGNLLSFADACVPFAVVAAMA